MTLPLLPENSMVTKAGERTHHFQQQWSAFSWMYLVATKSASRSKGRYLPQLLVAKKTPDIFWVLIRPEKKYLNWEKVGIRPRNGAKDIFPITVLTT